MTNTATFIKSLSGFRGDARLYKLDPPIETESGDLTDFVVVSAAVVPFSGPETYIFPADADGDITDWLELGGSFRGDLDHVEALDGAGYVIA